MIRRTLALAALALALAAPAMLAQAESREVGTYVMGGAALRVTAATPRVELLVVQSAATMMIYLDGRSVMAWADSAEKMLRLGRGEVPGGEVTTTILKHPDPSYGNGVMLARVFKEKRTQCYLYAWVGRGSYTAIPMSDKQARSVIAALKRAALEV